MQILAEQNLSGSGMRRQTTSMKSEHTVQVSTILQRFLMALMRAFAVAAT